MVDRLWPRGLSKEKAKIDEWMIEVAPSTELRKWFAHDPQRWDEFQQKYKVELDSRKDLLQRIKQIEEEKGVVTLLYSASERKYNNAVALARFLQDLEKT